MQKQRYLAKKLENLRLKIVRTLNLTTRNILKNLIKIITEIITLKYF